MHLVRVGAHGRAKKVISLSPKVNLVFALHPWFASWYCINSLPLVSIWIPSVVLSEMMECTCNCWAPPEMSDCRYIDEKQSSLEAYGMMVKGPSMDRGSGAFLFFLKSITEKVTRVTSCPAVANVGPLKYGRDTDAAQMILLSDSVQDMKDQKVTLAWTQKIS